jgi:hypothetical protein
MSRHSLAQAKCSRDSRVAMRRYRQQGEMKNGIPLFQQQALVREIAGKVMVDAFISIRGYAKRVILMLHSRFSRNQCLGGNDTIDLADFRVDKLADDLGVRGKQIPG